MTENTDLKPLLEKCFSSADEQRLKCHTYTERKGTRTQLTKRQATLERKNNTVMYLQNIAMEIYEYISSSTIFTQQAKSIQDKGWHTFNNTP